MKVTYIKVDNPWDVITTLRENTNRILFISERIFDFSKEFEGEVKDLFYSNDTAELIGNPPAATPYLKVAANYDYIVFDYTKQNIPSEFYTHMEYAERLRRTDKEVIVLCQYTDNVPGTLPSALVEVKLNHGEYIPAKELDYLSHLPKLLSDEARAAKISQPKCSLLVGPPGTGKTVAAQYTAALLDRPLFQLELSNLYNRLIGESEKALHSVLQYVETTKCVFFIDEVDKLFLHDSVNPIQQRILSMLLTWLSSGNKACYIMLAANRAAHIPIEMLRKGRVDKVIAVGLPDLEDISRLLGRRGEGLNIDPTSLVGFTQSEIIWYCNQMRERQFLGLPLDIDYVPLSKKLPHVVEEIEQWAKLYAG